MRYKERQRRDGVAFKGWQGRRLGVRVPSVPPQLMADRCVVRRRPVVVGRAVPGTVTGLTVRSEAGGLGRTSRTAPPCRCVPMRSRTRVACAVYVYPDPDPDPEPVSADDARGLHDRRPAGFMLPSPSFTLVVNTDRHRLQPVRSAYQPPASSTFLSERTSHQQPAATSQQYSSLRTNQHHPSATRQPNRLLVGWWRMHPQGTTTSTCFVRGLGLKRLQP
jgi:hypothetical protein